MSEKKQVCVCVHVCMGVCVYVSKKMTKSERRREKVRGGRGQGKERITDKSKLLYIYLNTFSITRYM